MLQDSDGLSRGLDLNAQFRQKRIIVQRIGIRTLRGGPIRSDSFVGLISYTRLLLCRPSDGVAVGHLVRG
jgi:hypothetical protein